MKKAKRISIILLTLIIAFSMIACQSADPATSGEGDAEETTFALKVGCMQADSHSSVLAFQKFKEDVEAASEGRVTVEIYSNAVLGDEAAMQEMMGMGTLDMMYTGHLPVLIPLLGALELPYLFEDRDHILAFHETDAFKELMAPLAEYNMEVVAAFENGFRQITNDKKPINSASDLKGMLFRTAPTPGELFAFEAAGAVATTIAYTELYSALQQGVVDGQENPIQNIYSAKFYEVQKYLAVTNHIYNSGFVTIRKDLYDSMPEDIRGIVYDCIKDAQDWQINYVADNDSRMLEEIEAYGVEVTYPDVAEMEEAMSGAYERMYEEYPEAEELVAAIRALVE